MTKALVKHKNDDGLSSFMKFAEVMAKATIIPENFRGKPADCMIAIDMAKRLDMPVVQVMQNLYIIHGRPSWSAVFVISSINASGKFTPLRFRMNGEGPSRTCVAWARDKSGEVLEGPAVSMQMARDEGWLGKSGSKWKTMPELMLRYRAATFFGRLYAPEILMGLRTIDEEADSIMDIEPIPDPEPLPLEDSGGDVPPEMGLPEPQTTEPASAKEHEEKPPADLFGADNMDELEKAAEEWGKKVGLKPAVIKARIAGEKRAGKLDELITNWKAMAAERP